MRLCTAFCTVYYGPEGGGGLGWWEVTPAVRRGVGVGWGGVVSVLLRGLSPWGSGEGGEVKGVVGSHPVKPLLYCELCSLYRWRNDFEGASGGQEEE